MKLSQLLLSATFALTSISAFASGGGGGGYGGGSYGGGSSFESPPVDQTYEIGKAIFKGRQTGVSPISYCVISEDAK